MTREDDPERRIHGLLPGLGAAIADLCRQSASAIGFDGAAVTIWSRGAPNGIVGWSDEVACRLDALEATLGEGPAHEAVGTTSVMPTADLAVPFVQQEWPAYAQLARELGVRCVRSVSVGVGDVALGTLTCWSAGAPVRPTADDRVALREYARRAAMLLVDHWHDGPGSTSRDACGHADGDGDGDGELPGGAMGSLHAVVHQASGVLAARLELTVAQAASLLRAKAFADGVPVEHVAEVVVAAVLEPGVARLEGSGGRAISEL